MPGRDQTGPDGSGPNGRGLGPCRDETAPGSFFGRFARRGRVGGRGRMGRGRRFWGSMDNTDLAAEESYLKQRLAAVQKQLDK